MDDNYNICSMTSEQVGDLISGVAKGGPRPYQASSRLYHLMLLCQHIAGIIFFTEYKGINEPHPCLMTSALKLYTVN